MVAKRWGPPIAGLFLAFPAIFPASVTLIEAHERQQKRKKGFTGRRRGTDAAADYAMGTALGSVGLLAFAFLCYRFLRFSPALTLTAATIAWAAASGIAWLARKRRVARLRSNLPG